MKHFLQNSIKALFVSAGLLLAGKSLKAQSTPDLIMTNLSANYDYQTALLTNISYTVKNQGAFTTFNAVKNVLSVVDLGSNSWKIGENITNSFGIAANATETLTMGDVDLDTVLTSSGNYYLKMVIDLDDDESESNETNNTFTGTNNPLQFTALVGIKENKKDNDVFFKCYPNPAKNVATINFSMRSEGAIKLNIIDITGKVVATIDNFENNTSASTFYAKQIDVSNLTDGFYFCQLVSGKTVVTEKLMVQH